MILPFCDICWCTCSSRNAWHIFRKEDTCKILHELTIFDLSFWYGNEILDKNKTKWNKPWLFILAGRSSGLVSSSAVGHNCRDSFHVEFPALCQCIRLEDTMPIFEIVCCACIYMPSSGFFPIEAATCPTCERCLRVWTWSSFSRGNYKIMISFPMLPRSVDFAFIFSKHILFYFERQREWERARSHLLVHSSTAYNSPRTKAGNWELKSRW